MYSPSQADCWRYARVVSFEEIGVDLMALCNGESVAWMTVQATLLLPPVRGVATPDYTNDELVKRVENQFGLDFGFRDPRKSPYITSTIGGRNVGNYEVIFDAAEVRLVNMPILIAGLIEVHDPGGPAGAKLAAQYNALGRYAMEPYLLEFLWPFHEIHNARLALAEFA